MNLIFFCTSFCFVYIIICLFPENRKNLTQKINAILTRAFDASTQELPKFALMRMLFGLIITIRAFHILVYLTPEDLAINSILIFALANLVFGIFIFLGFFAQYAFLYFILIQWQLGDPVLQTSTLGNDIGAIFAVFLFLVNAGKYYSIDSLLKKYINTRWLLYSRLNTDEVTIKLAKLISLFSYWLVCVYSLSMHINETAWMTGIAAPLIMTNNFMTEQHTFFTVLMESSDYAVLFAKACIWVMIGWYAAVLPFVLLGGVWRYFVIYWGLLFLLISSFVFQLGWLAEIELLFWACLFWTRRGIDARESYEVAYDDKCNLCDLTVKIIRRIDIFDQVKLMPISKNYPWLSEKGIAIDSALENLHGYDIKSANIFAGYDFYLHLCRKLILLWPLYPVLYLAGFVKLGPMIYKFVAKRRRAMFGICALPTEKRLPVDYGNSSIENSSSNSFIVAVLAHVFVLGVGYAIAIPAPYLGYQPKQGALARAAHIYGITPINVFNLTDMRMAENWFTLSLLERDTEIQLPFFAEDGSRLHYHDSDRIYFGNTVSYRRKHIGSKECVYASEKTRMEYLARVYLGQVHAMDRDYQFKYRQYYQSLPETSDILRNSYKRQPIKVRCEKTYTIKYHEKSV